MASGIGEYHSEIRRHPVPEIRIGDTAVGDPVKADECPGIIPGGERVPGEGGRGHGVSFCGWGQ